MPTRNVSLTPEQDAFIERVVNAGEYQNASEAIRDALRVLQQRRQEDALKLRTLRIQVKAGIDALERGDFTEVGGNDLDQYLEELAVPSAKRALNQWRAARATDLAHRTTPGNIQVYFSQRGAAEPEL